MPEEKLDYSMLIEEPRQVTYDWHIARVIKWLKYDNGRMLDNILVYASVDLRIAIERYLLEFLAILKSHNLSTKEKRRARSISGLFALIQETDQYYRKTAEFTLIICSITPEMTEISIVDTGYLRRKWEELSNYCHKQLEPAESFESRKREFQIKGFELVQEVVNRFWDWGRGRAFGLVLPDTMEEETKFIYDKFVSNEITADQANTMLKLIDPILRSRFRQKN